MHHRPASLTIIGTNHRPVIDTTTVIHNSCDMTLSIGDAASDMPKVVDIEQRRAELTEAAARLIARSGIESATMREVAAEAGWTTGALTHYFADKRELLLTTFQRRSPIAGRNAAHATTTPTPPPQLGLARGALPLDDAAAGTGWSRSRSARTQPATPSWRQPSGGIPGVPGPRRRARSNAAGSPASGREALRRAADRGRRRRSPCRRCSTSTVGRRPPTRAPRRIADAARPLGAPMRNVAPGSKSPSRIMTYGGGVRIVSLLPSATEILFELGVGDDVVGVTFECDFPPEARQRRIVSRRRCRESEPGGDRRRRQAAIGRRRGPLPPRPRRLRRPRSRSRGHPGPVRRVRGRRLRGGRRVAYLACTAADVLTLDPMTLDESRAVRAGAVGNKTGCVGDRRPDRRRPEHVGSTGAPRGTRRVIHL